MTGEPSVVSLFDVENVVEMPKVRDMTVGPVASSDVREFTQRYHYTQTAGHAMWRWGLWVGPILLGVIAYNWPSPVAAGTVFGPDHVANVLHMGRLALADMAPHNSESRLIGGSLRQLERQQPDIWAVLTYAATDQGHIGTVYQATNAFYTGLGGDRVAYRDADGGHHSPRSTLNGRAGRISKAAAKERGWAIHDAAPKHRYVYILGSKTQRRQRRALLKLPVLPYPKAVAS